MMKGTSLYSCRLTLFVRFRKKYVHLCNLLVLFEFVIPTIIDYGAAIKIGDYNVWKAAFLRILRFYLMCKCPGPMKDG